LPARDGCASIAHASWNCISRRTIMCMMLIMALALIWNLLGQ
jgi:hypothetical protein